MPAPSALSPRLAYERPHWSTKLDRLEISSWLLCEAFGRTFFLPCGRKARGSETPCDPLFMFWLSNTGIITRLCSLKLIWGEASLSLSSTVSFLVCHGGSAAESCRKLQNGVWHPGVVAYTFKPSTQEAEADLYELEASLVYRVPGQPELRRETLSQKTKAKQNNKGVCHLPRRKLHERAQSLPSS